MKKQGRQTRLMIADPQPVYVSGLVNGLNGSGMFEIVVEANGIDTARQAIDNRKVDMMIVDPYFYPGARLEEGLELIRYARAKQPSCKIVVLTVPLAGYDVVKVNMAGASALLLKDYDIDQIEEALVMIENGGCPPLPPSLEAELWDAARQSDQEGLPYELTLKEWRVLELLTEGLKDEEIAEKLMYSPRSVRRYNCSIYTKLGVKGRIGAVTKAYRDNFFNNRSR